MFRQIALALVALFLLATTASASAANLVIYDEHSENGFDQNCTFGGVAGDFDFANTAPVHVGTYSIRFTPDNYNAISWCTPATYTSPTKFDGIDFWVNGGAAGGQDVDVFLTLAGAPVASASLTQLNGNVPIPAGTWTHIQALFTVGPLAYNGNFDQISFLGNSAGTQPDIYFDDVSLLIPASALPDEIFKNDFEASAATAPLLIEQNVSACGGLTAERYSWQDAAGMTRSATLTHNDAGNAGHRGELCDYTYHIDTNTVRDVQELTAGGAGGFGYIVSHLVYNSAAYNAAIANDGDDSPLGHAFSGTFTRLLNGRHHAILRFQLNYPRWGVPASNVPTKYNVPVTIDWLIASGRDHPLWSVSFDLTAAPDSAIKADSRAPYGDMAFDGAGSGAGYGNNVGGVAWGDHYKFVTTQVPMTWDSGWNWNQLNTIPYVYLWTENPAPDAEMGIVQSEDIDKQDAGSEFSYVNWNSTSAVTTGCPGSYLMPCIDYQWAYQANADSVNATPGGDKHLTWGTGYGFLGYTGYNTDGTLTSSGIGWPYQSYSTHIVLGLHSVAPTAAEVTQIEMTMASTFSAGVGTVLTNGPAGVNRLDTHPYQPTGYNRVYGTWDVDVGASANAATFTLDTGAGSLTNPIFVLHNYTSPNPPTSVTLDGTPQTADQGYFATVDAAGLRLWITVNSAWSGSHTLAITP
jgi:hypothetical protein